MSAKLTCSNIARSLYSVSEIVIGEPRVDLSIVPLLQAHLPQDRRKVLPLPHKDAVLFVGAEQCCIARALLISCRADPAPRPLLHRRHLLLSTDIATLIDHLTRDSMCTGSWDHAGARGGSDDTVVT